MGPPGEPAGRAASAGPDPGGSGEGVGGQKKRPRVCSKKKTAGREISRQSCRQADQSALPQIRRAGVGAIAKIRRAVVGVIAQMRRAAYLPHGGRAKILLRDLNIARTLGGSVEGAELSAADILQQRGIQHLYAAGYIGGSGWKKISALGNGSASESQ